MKKYFNFKNFLILFMLIQPIFDLYFFYNSISTLIRVIIIFMFFIYILFKEKDKKSALLFLMYIFIIFIYFIVHDMHAHNVKTLVPGNFNYSTFEEILYFVKMLTPYMLIYVIYKTILKDKEINRIVKILICFISGSIVLTNLLGISLSSYNMEIIKGNFFTWFKNEYIFSQLASKGWFYFANHIIAILMLLLPIAFYYFIKYKKVSNYIIVFLLMFSLLLLGNKTSVFGSYFLFLFLFVFSLILYLLKKIKISKNVCIFSIIILFVFPFFIYYSPAYNRIITAEGTNLDYKSSNNKLETKLNYIAQNYKSKNVSEEFILKYYPYKYDPDFWLRIMKEPKEKIINYRFLEIEINKRIMEINHSSLDKWLGIGYSRQMNIVNIERDYINQFYAIGITGLVLFILPYFVLFAYCGRKYLNNKNNIFVIFLLCSLCVFLGIGYFSGNLLNSLSCTIFLSFILGVLLQKSKNS